MGFLMDTSEILLSIFKLFKITAIVGFGLQMVNYVRIFPIHCVCSQSHACLLCHRTARLQSLRFSCTGQQKGERKGENDHFMQ